MKNARRAAAAGLKITQRRRRPPVRRRTALLCNYIGLLLVSQSRRDGRLSWRSWLTHSGHFTYIVVTEWSPADHRSGTSQENDVLLTTELYLQQPFAV